MRAEKYGGEEKRSASGGKVSHLESWFANAIRVSLVRPYRVRIRVKFKGTHNVLWVLKL